MSKEILRIEKQEKEVSLWTRSPCFLRVFWIHCLLIVIHYICSRIYFLRHELVGLFSNVLTLFVRMFFIVILSLHFFVGFIDAQNWTYNNFSNFLSLECRYTPNAVWVWNPDGILSASGEKDIDAVLKSIAKVQRIFRYIFFNALFFSYSSSFSMIYESFIYSFYSFYSFLFLV